MGVDNLKADDSPRYNSLKQDFENKIDLQDSLSVIMTSSENVMRF